MSLQMLAPMAMVLLCINSPPLKKDGESLISFIKGKSRLAPIKSMTIPKLELTAATIVKLAETIRYEITEELEVTYYTDSTTVLNYIANDTKRWPVCVLLLQIASRQ